MVSVDPSEEEEKDEDGNEAAGEEDDEGMEEEDDDAEGMEEEEDREEVLGLCENLPQEGRCAHLHHPGLWRAGRSHAQQRALSHGTLQVANFKRESTRRCAEMPGRTMASPPPRASSPMSRHVAWADGSC